MLTEDEVRSSLIVALDCDKEYALELLGLLSGKARWVKVGMTLFYREGPALIQEFRDRGFSVFLDLKLHDIPFQVEGAAYSAALAGADIISLHALGSSKMIESARKGVERAHEEMGCDAKLVAISVLTSMDAEALSEIGIEHSVANEVDRLGALAAAHGSHGMVCSAFEAHRMREIFGDKGLIVVPGVRPKGEACQDQARVATPQFALSQGASKLVIGRPITQAAHPADAFEAIVEDICSAS